MRPGEGEGGVGEAACQGLRSLLAGQGAEVVGVEADAVSRRHDRARPVTRAGPLHRALDPPDHLDLGEPGPEQPRGRALEHPLEQSFEIRKHSHRGRNRTRGAGFGPGAATARDGPARTNVPRVPVPRSPAPLEHGPILLALARTGSGQARLRTGN